MLKGEDVTRDAHEVALEALIIMSIAQTAIPRPSFKSQRQVSSRWKLGFVQGLGIWRVSKTASGHRAAW